MYIHRLERLREHVFAEKACAAVVTDEGNLAYLTGFRGPGLLIISRDSIELYVPLLEYERARKTIEENDLLGVLDLYAYTPYMVPDVEGKQIVRKKATEILAEKIPKGCKALYDDMRLEHYKALVEGRDLKSIEKLLGRWRSIKEPWEIERIEHAVKITSEAILSAINYLDYGVSETELAGVIEHEMRLRGAEGYAFPTIVAFDDNTVYPHAEPSPLNIVVDETAIVIDAGSRYKGYCSDITRSLMYPQPTQDYKRVYEAVIEALNAAIDAIEPGAVISNVDEAARRVLRKHGLSKYFNHSLGHGIGIEVHEYPRISPDSKDRLEKGMILTIEPGVYMPGKFGVRVEEVVLVTSRGARILSRALPREYYW